MYTHVEHICGRTAACESARRLSWITLPGYGSSVLGVFYKPFECVAASERVVY